MVSLLLLSSLAVATDVDVAVDRRVELVSIVFRLGGAEEYGETDTPYARAVDAWFAPCREHAAVRAVPKLRLQRSIGYNAPADLALHLDPETLRPRVALEPWPARLDDRWDATSAKRFSKSLADFADECELDAFLASQEQPIQAAEQAYAGRVAEWGVDSWFDEVLGPLPDDHTRVVVGMLTGSSNYGCSVDGPEGLEISPVLGTGSAVDDEGRPSVRWSVVELLLVHEIGHARANPVFYTRDGPLAEAASRAFEPVAETMRAQAYPGGPTLAAETAVRALTVLYARDRRGPAGGEAQLAEDEGSGFAWLSAVVDAFDSGRAHGPLDLEAASLEVAKILDRWADDPWSPPFRGPINAVFRGPWWPGLALLSPTGPEEARAYVQDIHEQFYAPREGRLEEADGWSPSEPTAMALYGSPATSPVLAALLERLGWSVEAGGITLDGRRFPGERLGLIAAVPHPDAPSLPVLVYASSDPALVPGMNAVFHGPTDWVVVRHTGEGWEAVDQGDRR